MSTGDPIGVLLVVLGLLGTPGAWAQTTPGGSVSRNDDRRWRDDRYDAKPTPAELAADAIRRRIGHETMLRTVAPPVDKTDLQSFVDALGVAGKPTLIFFEAEGEGDASDSPTTLHRMTVESDAVEMALLFTKSFFVKRGVRPAPPPQHNSSLDFRVPIGMKHHFHAVRVNVLNIPADAKSAVPRTAAPVILITDDDGKVVATHSGRSLRPTSVHTSMARIMHARGYPDYNRKVSEAAGLLNRLFQTETRIGLMEQNKNPRAKAELERQRLVQSELSSAFVAAFSDVASLPYDPPEQPDG